MKKYLLFAAALLGLSINAHAATSTASPVILPTVLTASSSTATGTLLNLTVSSPTAVGVGSYSSGYFNYLTYVHIEMYATSTLTGSATPVICTFSNWPGSPTPHFPTALATGAMYVLDMPFAFPASATVSSQVMLVCPATASVVWNASIQYYQAQ